MTGEHDLGRLLAGMRPVLNPGRYVYATVVGTPPGGVQPVATVVEPEGTTLVLAQQLADDHGLSYDYVAAWITLRVHSALDAVGLTAAVATALASADLSCNVVAGFHHDHLFVPYDQVDTAIRVLHDLALTAGGGAR